MSDLTRKGEKILRGKITLFKQTWNFMENQISTNNNLSIAQRILPNMICFQKSIYIIFLIFCSVVFLNWYLEWKFPVSVVRQNCMMARPFLFHPHSNMGFNYPRLGFLINFKLYLCIICCLLSAGCLFNRKSLASQGQLRPSIQHWLLIYLSWFWKAGISSKYSFSLSPLRIN